VQPDRSNGNPDTHPPSAHPLREARRRTPRYYSAQHQAWAGCRLDGRDLDTEMLCCLGQVEVVGHGVVRVTCLRPAPLANAYPQDLRIEVSAVGNQQQGAEGVKEYELEGYRAGWP
jgi:hypothetical protein